MSTWPDIVEMRRGLALMLQGNPHFAWQTGDGSYRPCRDVGQLERFADDVFAGVKTAGFYAIRPDNRTRWGAIDYDAHGSVASRRWRDDARRAFETLAPKCAEAWLVESSPGGFHVVAFLAVLVPARDVRAMLGECAPESVEVFPKQDALRDNDGAKGSLLRFPGKHQLKGTWARFIARHGLIVEPEKGITAAKPNGGNWQEPSTKGRLWSLYSVATRDVAITGPGQRYHAMQRLAGRLKGRATEREALWVYTAWHRQHESLIRTPFEESRKAFLACFHAYAPCKIGVPDYPLTAAERDAIAALPKVADVRPEHLGETVRLFLCAKRHADTQGLRVFFLPNRVIADRLGCSINTASRIRAACVQLGVVQLVKAGHTGWASEYVAGKKWEPFFSSRMAPTRNEGRS